MAPFAALRVTMPAVLASAVLLACGDHLEPYGYPIVRISVVPSNVVISPAFSPDGVAIVTNHAGFGEATWVDFVR